MKLLIVDMEHLINIIQLYTFLNIALCL